MSQPPSKIKVHRKSRELELAYDDATVLRLPCELLRVYSPSAEVRGHSASERRLQTGKKYVNIDRVEPVGSYAVRICFDDGHDSGIYSWGFLEDLARNQERYWQQYLAELAAVNASRLPTIPVGRWSP
jgi:DUF971 family protein